MCIMFVTNKEKGLPTTETLEYIFKTNPDGGGLAYVHTDDNGKRHITMEKGIMTKEDWVKKVTEHFKRLNADSDYMIAHTRISTSGGKAPAKTHPFKMSNGGFLFQNGVSTRVEALMHTKESDTEWLAKNCTTLDEVMSYDKVSRFVIIKPDGTMAVSNNWVKDDQGRLWSNSGYESYVSRYSSGYYPRNNTWQRDYVDNECAYTRPQVERSPYYYSVPSADVMRVAINLVSSDGKLGSDIYKLLKLRSVYTTGEMLYVDGKQVKEFVTRDGVLDLVFANDLKDLTRANMDLIEAQINNELEKRETRKELFFDKDLAEDLKVGIKIAQSITTADKVRILYKYVFTDSTIYNGDYQPVHFMSSIIDTSFTVPANEQDVVRLTKEVIMSEILETQVDEEYYIALEEYVDKHKRQDSKAYLTTRDDK